jgi:hypothetical protein
LLTNLLLNSLHVFFGIKPPGGHSINAEEIAGIGLGVAALVGAIGYLVLRHRSSKQE